MLLEVARQLGLEAADIGVDIVFFDAEDYGKPEWLPATENGYKDWCLGSQYLGPKPHRIGYRARFGILLDMVGAKDAVFHQEGTSLRFAPHVVRKVWKRAADLGFGDRFDPAPTPPTIDDNYFVSDLAGIPSANIVDYRIQVRPMGYGPFHHTHADNMSVIDKETLGVVGTTVLSVVRTPESFTMGCQKPQRANAQGVQAPCTLDVMLSRRPFLLRALPIGLYLMVWACTGLAAAPVAHEVLDRADSLRHEGKLVQALSSYRTLLTEPVTGCEHARIHMGTAAVQWHAGNVSEAHPHLREVQTSCNTCPPHVRTPLALELAELLVRCGSTAEALDVLIRESDLHPSPEHAAEVQLALIELHFAEGHWAQVWNDASALAGPRAEGLRLQAGAMLGQPLAELPVDTYLKSARPSNHAEVVSELTHLHTLLTGAGRAAEALALAQRMGTLYDPLADPEPWTVAQLRIAVSAEQAGQPLDALLAFHEAGLVATQLDDMPLRARIAREQARFEEKRGATQAALQHLAMADSLTLAMLRAPISAENRGRFRLTPSCPPTPLNWLRQKP